jgi:hypothetical protein
LSLAVTEDGACHWFIAYGLGLRERAVTSLGGVSVHALVSYPQNEKGAGPVRRVGFSMVETPNGRSFGDRGAGPNVMAENHGFHERAEKCTEVS